MRTAVRIFITLLLVTFSNCGIVTRVCNQDFQCRMGACCAVNIWLHGVLLCTPLGQKGKECYPASLKVPFSKQCQHHTCHCAPNLQCSRCPDGKFCCSASLKSIGI